MTQQQQNANHPSARQKLWLDPVLALIASDQCSSDDRQICDNALELVLRITRGEANEDDVLNLGFCPDCGSQHFNRGPAAGLSRNVRCAKCGTKFCYSWPFTPLRINNPDGVYHLGTRLTIAQIDN